MAPALQHYPTSLPAPSFPKLQIQISSHRRLALALAVLKSKPADISLDEFFSQVVSRIQAGARRVESTQQRKHLDSAAFWRQAYENSEAAQSKLLDRVYELEQKLDSHHSQASQGIGKFSVKKRKGEAADQTGVINGRSKRQKSKVSSNGEGEYRDAFDDGFDEVDRLESTDVENTILRSFFHLHKAIAQRKPDPGALASASAKFSTAASLAILVALRSTTGEKITSAQQRPSNPNHSASRKDASLGDQPQRLAAVLAVLEKKGYPLVLRALDKAKSIEDAGRSRRKITHALIMFFRTVLKHLHETFVKSAQDRVDEEKETRRKKTTTKRRNLTLTKGASTPQALNPRAPQLISRFLVRMVDTLDASRPESADLLEGYLACLLDQVGKRLCVITFGQEKMRANNIEQDEEDISQIRSRGLGDNLREEVSRRATQEESGHLTRILKRGLSFAKANPHLLFAGQRVEGREGEEKTALITIIKRRLQNTLLKGVFGDDEVFRDCLNSAESGIGSDLEVDGGCETDEEAPGDRFTREVWELIGWDVLTEAIEFTDGGGSGKNAQR